MRRILILLTVLLLFVATGCSEDTTNPVVTPFALNLIVTDAAGERLEGIEVRAHVQIPGFNPNANKALTKIPFFLHETCDVMLNIYDVESRLIKTTLIEDARGGFHEWAAVVEEDGVPLTGTGLYRYELVASVDGTETFRDSKTMTVYDSMDSDQQPVLGLTDAQGRISYTDQTRFPFLYEKGPQPGLDENGESVGSFDFSDMVAFTLVNTHANTNQSVVVEAVVRPELNIITLVWDESLLQKATEWPDTIGPVGIASITDPLPTESSLEQNYPNPFN